ncbi:hypothetical protein Vretimale_13437 [Volvox reticuliferus]|uniref:Uncharacterized protein n=1 Tax=Volvox reticuliferus TaxID=1737510 RepID=A0A8J4GLJ7_9CHLO|nr:hypothetical protein Vretimale_13437 [Volvox reticuliferus]
MRSLVRTAEGRSASPVVPTGTDAGDSAGRSSPARITLLVIPGIDIEPGALQAVRFSPRVKVAITAVYSNRIDPRLSATSLGAARVLTARSLAAGAAASGNSDWRRPPMIMEIIMVHHVIRWWKYGMRSHDGYIPHRGLAIGWFSPPHDK